MVHFQIRSVPYFHKFSSKMVHFRIRSVPQFHQFPSEMVHFQKRNLPRFHQFSSKICPLLKRSLGGRVGSVGSGRRFAFSYSVSFATVVFNNNHRRTPACRRRRRPHRCSWLASSRARRRLPSEPSLEPSWLYQQLSFFSIQQSSKTVEAVEFEVASATDRNDPK